MLPLKLCRHIIKERQFNTMKKLINAVFAAAALLACALPCYAAEVSPVTGDITMYVVIALIVAAVAIVGTLIYSKFKK